MAEDAPPVSGQNRELAEQYFRVSKEHFESGDYAKAETVLRRAIDLQPQSARYWGSLGTLLMRTGEFGEAKEALERALPLDPKRVGTYFDLVFSGRVTEADRLLVDQMERLVAEGMALSDRKHLEYALGKAYDDLGEYGRAMPHFEAANDLARAENVFDFVAVKASFADLQRTFTSALINAHISEGNSSTKPILIVGMMRSGTTLVEQIVSSHPDVFGAGELPFWSQNRMRALKPSGTLNPGAVNLLANEYLSLLDHLAPGKKHVTDKMPQNFLALGLIHLAFPNAKIIHCRRDPVDTCLSIYFTPNDTLPWFFHDKARLAEFYRLYVDLMRHWRLVLPEGCMLDIDYEEMVNDREGGAKRLLAFLNLPWDETVLSYERSGRAVKTASLWQVRQPIYRSSLKRSDHYLPWLGPIAELAAKA